LFLFDNAVAHEWKDMESEVRRLCERIAATLEVCVKYDERKLAYEIRKRKRGTYVLAYFQAEPTRIVDLERDAGLSEGILRSMVVRAEQITPEKIAELQQWPAEAPLTPLSGDGRRHGEDDGRGRRRSGEGDERGEREDRGGRGERDSEPRDDMDAPPRERRRRPLDEEPADE